jgi:DNA-binding MarR family transcriptional regulator
MMTSQVIRKLAGSGLVERQPDPADSRARLLLLLRPAGRALLSQALADVEPADQAYFSALRPDRGCFLAGLAALSAPAGRRR